MEATVLVRTSKHHSKICQSFCSQCFLNKDSTRSNVNSSHLFLHLCGKAQDKTPAPLPTCAFRCEKLKMSLAWSSAQHELYSSCPRRAEHPRLLTVRPLLCSTVQTLFPSPSGQWTFFPEGLLPHQLLVCSLLTSQDATPNVNSFNFLQCGEIDRPNILAMKFQSKIGGDKEYQSKDEVEWLKKKVLTM